MIPTNPDPDTQTERPATIARIATAADPEESGLARPPSKLLVTPEEAAAVLSIGRTKVYQLMADGQLSSVRLDGCRRVPVAALKLFVQQLLDSEAEEDRRG